MGLLANISLTEEQRKEFTDKLDNWKNTQVTKLEKDLTSKFDNRLKDFVASL